MDETKVALAALDNQDKEKALEALATVTGKLELIVARDPSLSLAPVEVKTIVHDMFASTDTIQPSIDYSIKALKRGEVQKARKLLSGLASEVIVQISCIPLATYPQAIKVVAPLIDKGKFNAAKMALQSILGTVVITENEINPLPVLRARSMLTEAKILSENSERSEEDSLRLSQLLDGAKKSMELAELLGYGHKKTDYKDLFTQLKEIEEKVSDGKGGLNFFDKITATFVGLFDKKNSPDEKQVSEEGATKS
ncbi:MAG: YfdX family protein [Magnetococcales bacterium]|nr:YfdX family protein [Magnetococcales bacterium]